MEGLVTVAFAVAAGLTFCGLAGSAIETMSGSRLSLGAPFVSSGNISRSLVLVLLAGPFMTLNEAVTAMRDERIGQLAFAGIAGFCLAWAGATGVFVLGLVEGLRQLGGRIIEGLALKVLVHGANRLIAHRRTEHAAAHAVGAHGNLKLAPANLDPVLVLRAPRRTGVAPEVELNRFFVFCLWRSRCT